MPRTRRNAARRGEHTNDWTLRAQRRRMARQVSARAAAIGCAFELEWFVSGLLGRIWERRNEPLPGDHPGDDQLALTTMVEVLVQAGGHGARLTLEGIARLDRGGLGMLAAERAHALAEANRTGPELPSWLPEVGRAPIASVRAAMLRGGGEGLFLEVRHEGFRPHTVAVFVDDTLGGIAKHLALLRPIDFEETPGPWDAHGEDLRLRSVAPDLACARVERAIERTDAVTWAPVGETYGELRALVLARVTARGAPRSGGPSVALRSGT